MTIDNMRILIAVYETGSVTKAAEKLFLSQPSVSIAIKTLETEYGQIIFERYSRHLKITPFGEHLVEYATRIVALYDEMNHVAELNALYKDIRIGAGTTVGELLLPSAVSKFNSLFPEINITVKIDHLANLRKYILDNQLDFAIAEAGQEDNVIVSQPLLECPFVAICSRNHPLAYKESINASDLAKADILARQKGSYTRQVMDYYFKSQNITVVPKWESSDSLAILYAVKKNLGIGFLALYHVQMINDDSIVILNVEDFSATYFQNLYYHKDKSLTQPMEDFINTFMEYNKLNS